ncbi:Ferrous iron transport periplasmic protein EfeO, contains peptidase-M75 domain and (frequently) cupredoxin-like domain [Microbacterium esteraromaticum]|uniref:Ferrous iron transport periplasmic protein EfeO, contains peptidase-M75 domain and (Frequently) cupredoxin-like domain n=1 Tax=Microbacterium esteraromaticum TaxID=57043 RepID=A0A1R4JKS0_9MICO|nr:iron uptake system protein EfeO [Microbacterium esteraromaticum]SJN32395.1 Ferrous iron transport periplasmic protein EfeO, contains peptidase-M75 domain and (frequently) cupredoxin-like domain [Microbacterium esteraromaticum]
MTTPTRLITAVAATGAAAIILAGCVAKNDVADAAALTVSSTDGECAVSQTTATSGTLTFDVSNDSTQVTEFYLLAEDGLRIVGEVENIAPSASRTLTVVAQPGEYFTLCKPGMLGAGVGKAGFTVTGDVVTVDGPDSEQKQQAVDLYAAFVKDQVGQLVPAIDDLVAAYESGDDDTARALFPNTRAFYERIEPVAESLGALDPRIDYREVDAVAEGMDWTGFHRIEKDLWVPAEDALNADGETPAWQDWAPSTTAERGEFGDQLIADVQELYSYVHSDDFTEALDAQGIAGISNGAIALLDEVATGKISGEEDWWSGTDLWDFAANVEGSEMAFSLVRDLAVAQGDSGADLVDQIETGYAALKESLMAHGSLDDGFIGYGELSGADKRELTDLINALAEPLSQLTGTVLS